MRVRRIKLSWDTSDYLIASKSSDKITADKI